VITTLGRRLALLPVEPSVGKMLLAGSLLRCVDFALTAAACAGARNPFVASPTLRDESQRQQALTCADSDLEAAVRAFEQWRLVKAERGAREAAQWAWDRCLVQSALSGIELTRRQLGASLAKHAKLFSEAELKASEARVLEASSSSSAASRKPPPQLSRYDFFAPDDEDDEFFSERFMGDPLPSPLLGTMDERSLDPALRRALLAMTLPSK
jgi:HrpA-like RNA helicase